MSKPTLLVTGGCGYLGAHLLREIAADSNYARAHVRVLDNLSSGSVAAILDLPEGPRYEFVEGDILAPATVRMALKDVDTVIHLAALVRTPFAFDQPRSIQQVNHWGTVRLLEHCIETEVRRFVYASSVSVYGPGENFTETAACRPIGPYSCSKRDAERAVLVTHRPSLKTTVLRIATLYGGDPGLVRFDAVANRFAYLAGTARSISIFGNGNQKRPILHVRDAAKALLYALHKDSFAGETYNVAEANPSIDSLAQEVKSQCSGARIRYTDQDYREHISLSVDSTKLRKAGWKPAENFKEGLQDLLEHFRNLSSLEWKDADQVAREIDLA